VWVPWCSWSKEVPEKDIYKEGLIISNELSTIYIEYFVKPILLKHFGYTSWQNFTNELSLLEQEIDKNQHKSILAGTSIKYEELYKPLISFLEPVQDEIEVSLTNIRYLRIMIDLQRYITSKNQSMIN